MALDDIFNNKEKSQHYEEGTVIFREGSEGEKMYIIIEGSVEINIGKKVVETLHSGNMFGEMAMIDNRRRSATATAKTNCRLVEMNQKEFNKMIEKEPLFAQYVLQILVTRLRNVNLLIRE